MHQQIRRHRQIGLIAARECGAISVSQDVELSNCRPRRGHERCEQLLVVTHPAAHGGGVEQIAVELTLECDAGVALDGVHEQVEVLTHTRHRQQLGSQAVKRHRCRRHGAIEIENHRHQRQPAWIARDRQHFQQLAKAERLMLEGIQRRGPHVRQQRVRTSGRVYADPHRQHVHAVTDEAFVPCGRLPGRRDTDHQIILPGQAMHQRRESAEQRGEQTASSLRTGRPHGAYDFRRNQVVLSTSDVRLERRPRAIAWQIENRQHAGELLQPVSLIVPTRRCRSRERLVPCEIGESFDWRKRGRHSSPARGVQRCQLRRNHAP